MRRPRARRRSLRLPMSTDRRNDRPTRPLALVGPAQARAIFLVLLAAASCGPAGAQTSITATIASEYSLRGLSLSDARAVPQLRIDHDTAGGAYAGLFASRVFLAPAKHGPASSRMAAMRAGSSPAAAGTPASAAASSCTTRATTTPRCMPGSAATARAHGCRSRPITTARAARPISRSSLPAARRTAAYQRPRGPAAPVRRAGRRRARTRRPAGGARHRYRRRQHRGRPAGAPARPRPARPARAALFASASMGF